MPLTLLLPILAASVVPLPATAVERLRYPLACKYFSDRDLEDAEACLAETPRGIAIRPGVLRDLSYRDGLATFTFGDHRWFYRARSGRTAEMVTFDNGPDTFAQGRARSAVGGRLAYVDRRLRVRIRTSFDFGSPFGRGRAVVCTGCVEQRIDGGEHTILVGGRWGVIDRRGRIVVPVTLSAEQLDRLPPNVTGRP